MDKLQEELDNVRRDLLKFSFYSSGSNPDIRVEMDSDDGEEEKMSETSGTLRHEGSREVMQSHSARNLSIEMFDLDHDHDSYDNITTHYHEQGVEIPTDRNSN